MVKLRPIDLATILFLAIFLLSFAEIAAFGFVGAFTSFQYVIAAQMGISCILFFIVLVVHIFEDISKKI
jgi:hypothetical protein